MDGVLKRMGKKLVLYGAGEQGKRWINKIGENRVWKFGDSNPNRVGTIFCSKEVAGLTELSTCKDMIEIFVSVSGKYQKEIRKILEANEMGRCIIESPYLSSVVRMGENSRLNIISEFEGNNYVGNSSCVENSYMGYASYIANNTILPNVKIGKYCAIAEGVTLIRGQHPTRQFVSIHPAFYSPGHVASNICYVNENLYEEFRYTTNGYVVDIGNDVWIGKNVQIMEGIKVDNGAIIAAGALVTKNVRPYTIVGGIPARQIRNRFSEAEKEFLEKLQWWNKSEDWLKENAKYFSDIKKLQSHLKIK